MKEFFKQLVGELPGLLREQGKKIIICLLLLCAVGVGIWYSYKSVTVVSAKNQRAVELLKASISDRSGKKQQKAPKVKKTVKKITMKKEEKTQKKVQTPKEVVRPTSPKTVISILPIVPILAETSQAQAPVIPPPTPIVPQDPAPADPMPTEPDLPPLPPSFADVILIPDPQPMPSVEIVFKNIQINEIKTYGEAATDQFVELYNPNTADINLKGFALKKKTSTGTESNLVSQASFEGTISAGGFFLIAPVGYSGTSSPDLYYSGSSYTLAQKDNTVLLYNDKGELADKMGFGSAADSEALAFACAGQTQCIPKTKSIERKTLSQDSDNNAEDFLLLESPTPQGTTSH